MNPELYWRFCVSDGGLLGTYRIPDDGDIRALYYNYFNESESLLNLVQLSILFVMQWMQL